MPFPHKKNLPEFYNIYDYHIHKDLVEAA